MNMKLTKEQAEWLINIIGCSPHYKHEMDPGIEMCMQIIEQCTEKEFPIYACTAQEDNEILICQSAENNSLLLIETQYTFNYFTYDGFIQFAEACNKIVEWIKNQKEV